LKQQKRIKRPRKMPKFYYESGWVQSSSVLIVLGCAYGDTAAATSCNKWSQYVK